MQGQYQLVFRTTHGKTCIWITQKRQRHAYVCPALMCASQKKEPPFRRIRLKKRERGASSPAETENPCMPKTSPTDENRHGCGLVVLCFVVMVLHPDHLRRRRPILRALAVDAVVYGYRKARGDRVRVFDSPMIVRNFESNYKNNSNLIFRK